MRIGEMNQTPGEEFDLLKDAIMKELHVATPGIVQSFDSATQTATIKPAIRTRKDGKSLDLPPLMDVPVYFPGGSAGALTWPVEAGDECLVIFADGCIDEWFKRGGVNNAISMRSHDYSDGFAFVGFRSKAKSIAPFPPHPESFGSSGPFRRVAEVSFTSGTGTLTMNTGELLVNIVPVAHSGKFRFYRSNGLYTFTIVWEDGTSGAVSFDVYYTKFSP